MSKKPTVLMILDGYGLNVKNEANAVYEAKTPVMDKLMAECPFVKGNASGMAVGLPEGQMGNSEVGHLNMGAGRIVYQDLTKITKSIMDGDFFTNPALLKCVNNAVKNDKESKTVTRDYAIVTLFLNCGMRVSELVGINLEDVDRELRSMTVTGKGNKQRIIYLNEACKASLSDYYEIRKSDRYKTCTERALFLSNRNQRISVKTVQWLVYKYLDMAGLESKHYSVHKLRHTAATLMYQTGNVDVRVLKDILGHEQLNTTQIYTHVSNRSMEEAMEKNPLASLGSASDKK